MTVLTSSAPITFISAGAGSGKTHRLTELLQQALCDDGVRPAGVMATTFTNKAATELRERVQKHLLQHGHFGLAHAMGQARIGTVHAICGQLLSRFAFEAGLPPEQHVLDEPQSSALLAQAVDTVLAGDEQREIGDLAARLSLDAAETPYGGKHWKNELHAVVTLIRSNNIALSEVPAFAAANADDLLQHFPRPTTDDLSAALHSAIEALLPDIEAAAQAGGKANTNTYLSLVSQCSQNLGSARMPWKDWLELADKSPEVKLKPTIAPITRLAARVCEHPGLQADIRRYLEILFTLAAKSIAAYQALKAERGALDFVDQEHLLLRLLDHAEVRTVLADELDLLLVDEFQDTNPIQLALFLKLAEFAKKVIWVGDIKQAIYGFRGSDTALMQEVLRALPSLGGHKEVLGFSWRSRPELVATVNAVFTHALGPGLPPADIELQPQRQDAVAGPAIGNWILGGKKVEDEVSALASGVRRLLESGQVVYDKARGAARPVREGDIAILARSNNRAQQIANALLKRGVPVAIARWGLLETPEVTLALACLRRLIDPADTLATAEIAALSAGGEPESWLAARLRYLDAEHPAADWLETSVDGHPAHPVLEQLAALRTQLPLLTPREALASVVASCGLAEKVARWSLELDHTRQRLANVETLLTLAQQYEDACCNGREAASILGLLLWLKEKAAQKEDKQAQPAIDAVHVLTYHAAKGLEWPVVILADLGQAIKDDLWSISVQSQAPFDAHNPLAQRFIRHWPWPFGTKETAAIRAELADTPVGRQFRAQAVDEAKRLLYVAMTRARDFLVLARSSRNLQGEWLSALEASWLLPGKHAEAITLPTGETVPALCWELEPGEPQAVEAAPAPAYWFQASTPTGERLPLYRRPSAAATAPSAAWTVQETCLIGHALAGVEHVDANALGLALHACLAAAWTPRKTPLAEADVARILEGFFVPPPALPPAVLQQIHALHSWLAQRWPGARAQAEMDVQQLLPSGQVLTGRVDLLLETDAGWVLLDHKAARLPHNEWDRLAAQYGPQMDAYAQAVAQVSGRPVREQWLFLPASGGAVRLARG